MAVRSSSKSSTAQPPPSNMSQTSTQISTSAINWQPGECDPSSRMKDMESRNKKEIARRLNNDRGVIKNALSAEAKKHDFKFLDQEEQKRRLEEAALRRVQQRINDGQYTSCTYSEFAGYIPRAVFGSSDGSKDLDKEERMTRQLAALRKKFAVGQLDGDDDEDEIVPPGKIEKGDIKQEMDDVPPYVKPNTSKPSGHSRDHQDKKEANSEKKATMASQKTQNRSAPPHTLKRNRVDKNNGNKKEVITWRAVSRGQPLPPGVPAADFEQRKPKINPWLERIVFRGQPLPQVYRQRISSRGNQRSIRGRDE